MSIVEKIKSLLGVKDADGIATAEKPRAYLTGKEIRAIAKANAKVMMRLEKYKNRKADESEFVTEINKAVEAWMEWFKAMSPAIQEQADKVIQLEKQYKTLAEAMKNPVTATQQVKEAFYATKTALADARKELNKLQEPTKQATSWFWKLLSPLKNLASRSLVTWLLSTFWAFSLAGWIKKVLQGIINTMKESVKTFISFESAFAGVKKTVEATDYQFDAFNRTLKEMTTYIPMAYEDLAKIAELGWQMGVPIENLQKFTETLAAISVSTNLWLEDAALALSRITSVMWIDYNDVDKLGSAIVDLWNNFAATESEITTFVEKIAWVGNVVWLTAWDVTWIAASVTSVWVAAEKWWTAINKLLIAMNDAAVEWWDKLKTLATITGMTADEFQKLWKTDAWEAFVKVIEWMWNAWDKAVSYIEDLVGTWTRVKEVFLNMAAASDKVREAVTRGNRAYDENRALMEEAAKRYGTTESKMQMLNNQITLNKELLGQTLIPVYMEFKHILVDLSNWLIQVVEKFNALSDWEKYWVIAGGIWAISIALWIVNPLLWVLFALVAWWTTIFAALYDSTEDEAYALGELHRAMEDTNDALYENEKAIWKLNDEFEQWVISIEEYQKSLKELMKTQRELKKEQQELSEQIVAFEKVADTIDDMDINFENRVTAISDLEEEMLTLERRMKDTKDAIADLDSQYKYWSITTETYKEKSEELRKLYSDQQDELVQLDQAHRDAEASLQRYWAAYEKVAPWLRALNDVTDNQIELEKVLSDIVINTDASQAQINALKARFEELRAAAILAVEAMITAKNLEIEQKVNLKEWGWITWWSKLWHGNRYNKQVDELDNLREKLANLKEMTFEDVLSWAQTEKQEVTEALLWIDVNDWSIDELKQNIEAVRKQKEKYNETSEEYVKLWEKEAAMQERLKNAIEEETEALEESAEAAKKAWAKQEDLIEIEEKRLDLEARKKVLALDKAALKEEDYANAVLKINEDLEKAKDDLRKDWYDKEVEAMEDIIEKYKELREEAAKALSNLASDFKTTSADIAKLVQKIQDLRKELEDLNKDRVKDLGNRYVELQKTLEEIDKDMAELKAKTSEWWDSGQMVYEAWENIKEWIDDATSSVDSYQKEIDKLIGKIKDLESDTSDKLSERYASVVEELWELNKQLEVYTRYDILTDADAKAKQKLEEQIAELLWEKNKIEQNLTEAQLERAESMVGETETDKILRQAAEQKAAYQQEIDEYQNKLDEQQSILENYRAEQSAMIEKYNWLDTQSEQAKYDEMIKQLEDYAEQRNEILKEMDMISQNLTAQEIQEAIINSKKTETELILENYYTQKQALEDELADYEAQLRKKLALLADYYGDVALLQQKYWDLWLKFSDEDLKKLKEAAENLKLVREWWYSTDLSKEFSLEKQSLAEQEKAKQQLENISKNLEKLTDYQMKKLWSDTLKALYEKIVQLQLTASWQGIGTGNVTNTSNINQNFNVNNINDAAVIASAIRRQIKL